MRMRTIGWLLFIGLVVWGATTPAPSTKDDELLYPIAGMPTNQLLMPSQYDSSGNCHEPALQLRQSATWHPSGSHEFFTLGFPCDIDRFGTINRDG